MAKEKSGMQKFDISSSVTTFVDRDGRSSCGMINTIDGVVLVDTTARPVDIKSCLNMAGVHPAGVCQVLITHSHSDHTSGIPLFDYPVLAIILTKRRSKNRRTARSKKQVPPQTFDVQKLLKIGGMEILMIHTGGHTPGSSIVWLTSEQTLFAGDLIFAGRYPFLATANVKELIEVLRRLPGLGARVIVPGHGALCDFNEVNSQRNYIEITWELTAEHIKRGHSLDEAVRDRNYPVYSKLGFEKLHSWNIKVCYRQLSKLIL
jgi:cyclase